VRDAAAQALGKIGPQASSAVPALLDAFVDPDEIVGRSAAEAILRIEPEARPPAAVPERETGESLKALLGRAKKKLSAQKFKAGSPPGS
jgi:HEAT repeat protein